MADRRYKLISQEPQEAPQDGNEYARKDGEWVVVGTSSGGAVTSVFGRTGVVTAQVGDYSSFYAPLSHSHLAADLTVAMGDLTDFNDADNATGNFIFYNGTDYKSTQNIQWDTSDTTLRIGNNSGADMSIDRPLANGAGLFLRAASVDRWGLRRLGTSADFALSRYNSSGVFQENTFSVNAASGNATFAAALTANSTLDVTGTANFDGTNVNLNGGCLFRVYDSGDTKYVGFDHNGTNGRLFATSGEVDIGVTGTDAVALRYNNVVTVRTQSEDASGQVSGLKVRHYNQTFKDVGAAVETFSVKNTSFSSESDWLDRVGETIFSGDGTAYTYTTPASTATAIPNGAWWNIVNLGAGNITLAAGSGVTLRWLNGAGSTGSRTIAQWGSVKLWRRTASLWYLIDFGGVT